LYYGARTYDPALGRFIQPDTIVPNPANPQSLNRYAYVLNNPLRYTDPTGHSNQCAVAGEGCLTLPGAFPFAQNPEVVDLGKVIAGLLVSLSDIVTTATQYGQAYSPQVTTIASEAAKNAENAQRAAQQGGEPANSGGPNMDPWRWGKDYRQNYERYYGVKRDPDYQVNHILPQQFRQVMADVGINIDDPRWLREVQWNPALGNNHQEFYTNAWGNWVRNLHGRTPTAAEVVQFAQQLEQDYIAKFGTALYREGEGLPGLIDWAALWAQIQAATQANAWTAP